MPAAIIAAVALVVGVVGFVVVGGDEAGADVTLEAATAPGPDPFSESMAVVEVAEFPGDVEAVITSARAELPSDDGTLRASGTDPGLYGGTQDEAVCDADRLIAFLDDNPDKATAWAQVAGIPVDDIADFIGSLTSVVLTTDTWVTNHGFANGRATPRQSVLQAGTAVMVDDRGVPRVKCGCGNPLLAPAGDADLAGADGAWAGYDPDQVAVIDPGEATDALTVVDIDTGDTYQQTIGGVDVDELARELVGLRYDFGPDSGPPFVHQGGDEGLSGTAAIRGPDGFLELGHVVYKDHDFLVLEERDDGGTYEVVAVQPLKLPSETTVELALGGLHLCSAGGVELDENVAVIAPEDGGPASEAWRADAVTRTFESMPADGIECR